MEGVFRAADGPRARARSVAGVAVDDGRLLIARRREGGAIGGMWEFPGGKVEDGETDAEALEREFEEEFGVAVDAGPFLARAEFSHGGRLFLLNAYRVTPGSLDFVLREHVEWRWATLGEIDAEKGFADSDRLLLPSLRASLFAR